MQDLDQSLRKLNSRLFVLRGDPLKVLPTVFGELGIKFLFCKTLLGARELRQLVLTTTLIDESDTEPYAVMRDAKINEIAHAMGIKVAALLGHTMYDPNAVASKNHGKPPMTYQGFLKVTIFSPTSC